MVLKISKKNNISLVLITYIVTLVLLVLAFVLNSDFFIYGVVVLLTASIVLFPRDKSFLIILMAVSIGDMITISSNYTTSLFGFVLVAYVIKNISYIKVRSYSFVLYCSFAIYMILGMRIGQESLFSDIQTIINYFVLYQIITQFEVEKLRLYFNAFICGHLISTLVSFFILSTYRYSLILDDNSVELINSTAIRFSGMQIDPNFYALFCLAIVGILFFSIANDSYTTNKKLIVFLIIFYLIMGVISLSKMFIIVVCGIILYFYLSKNDVTLWKKIGSVIFIILLIFTVNEYSHGELFDFLFGRFLNLNRYYGSTINALTTGRLQIWKSYYDDWKNSLNKIIFGVGLANKKLSNIGKMHHQTYIEILYQFGVLGTSIFLLYIHSLYKNLRIKVELSIDLDNGRRIGSIGFIILLMCGATLGLFALNVTIYILTFSLAIMAISKKRK